MKFEFKHPRAIDGKHYAPGIHDLPDHLEDHWYLKGLHESGDVVFLGFPEEEIAPAGKPESEPQIADASEGLTDEPAVEADEPMEVADEDAEPDREEKLDSKNKKRKGR